MPLYKIYGEYFFMAKDIRMAREFIAQEGYDPDEIERATEQEEKAMAAHVFSDSGKEYRSNATQDVLDWWKKKLNR